MSSKPKSLLFFLLVLFFLTGVVAVEVSAGASSIPGLKSVHRLVPATAV